MELETILGLETHVQLNTATKLFCSCPLSDADAPNTNICPVCTGHPGVLPVANVQAIRSAVLFGLALEGTIAPRLKFDRKHYFYPDLPKAYQISQFDEPVMSEGRLTVDVPGEDEPVTIRIERLHLEEDAAKNTHADDGATLVDYNRGGAPLCEIVTKPDFRTAAQAKAYVQELRRIARTLGVADADMERGHLRCDVNISLRPVGSTEFFPKTEIKNINSFRNIERAIAFEIRRQTALWEEGVPPAITTTRGWNDVTQQTDIQREKESSADYRYFPEPDLPPVVLTDLAEELRSRIPELPAARRTRFVVEYGIKHGEAAQLIDDPSLADFAEATFSELQAWLAARPDTSPEQAEEGRKKLARLVTGWLLSKLTGLLEARGESIATARLTPENFAELLTMVADGRLTGSKALEVLEKMLEDGSDPSHVAEALGAVRVEGGDTLTALAAEIVTNNPAEAARYRAGETKLLQFFVGQMMKATQGNADPAAAADALTKALGV